MSKYEHVALALRVAIWHQYSVSATISINLVGASPLKTSANSMALILIDLSKIRSKITNADQQKAWFGCCPEEPISHASFSPHLTTSESWYCCVFVYCIRIAVLCGCGEGAPYWAGNKIVMRERAYFHESREEKGSPQDWVQFLTVFPEAQNYVPHKYFVLARPCTRSDRWPDRLSWQVVLRGTDEIQRHAFTYHCC